MDLRTHKMKTIEGSTDFYGRPLDQKGEVQPQDLMQAIHPDDVAEYAQVVERCESLQFGEEILYQVRARHTDGYWVLARCRARAIEWDVRGFAITTRAEVEMSRLT